MKLLAIFLLVLSCAGTFVPCCQEDCAMEIKKGLEDSGGEEGSCSPLFSCAGNPSFVVLSNLESTIPSQSIRQPHEDRLYFYDLSTYAKSPWQPPRKTL